ncbi:lysozyme inhibitor LprI family protein [Klebsiella aerogenes]|uniref:lysozyme inhibitor LprI family protein n=1 Tax=Klebsiella aerogenes TaxID=548 RepID=UPI001BD05000|nr:lysozyme inhibitor LprI family protein [Klebsiella aerogenes]
MRIKNNVLALLLILPCVSHATLTDYSKIEADCRKNNQDINNSVVMGCADQASDAAKKDMNIVYQKIYKIIRAREIPDITSKFEAAQKNWIASREDWCDVQGFIIGSPMYSVCRMDLNISRVNELNDLLEQIQD